MITAGWNFSCGVFSRRESSWRTGRPGSRMTWGGTVAVLTGGLAWFGRITEEGETKAPDRALSPVVGRTSAARKGLGLWRVSGGHPPEGQMG